MPIPEVAEAMGCKPPAQPVFGKYPVALFEKILQFGSFRFIRLIVIGVGNGNIASHEPNKTTYRTAYNGLCAVIIQSTLAAGEIIISASSPNLISGEFKINSVSQENTAKNTK